MTMSNKEIDRIDDKIDKERFREKDGDTLKVIESVFDFQTSMLIVKLMNKGIVKDIVKDIMRDKITRWD